MTLIQLISLDNRHKFIKLSWKFFYFLKVCLEILLSICLHFLQGTTTDPIAEHAAVTTIIAVIILAISVTKDTIITTLVDLVILAQVITTMEIVTAEVVPITEIVTAEVVTITEIVTAEVDTQIAIHVLVHIQALVEDLATNAAIALEDGKCLFTFFFKICLQKYSTVCLLFSLICLQKFNSLFTFFFNLFTKIQLFFYFFL